MGKEQETGRGMFGDPREATEAALRREAADRGVSVEALRAEEPAHVREAREYAAARGLTLEAALAGLPTRSETPVYPTPDCLTPDQIADLAAGESIDDAAAAHLTTCPVCQRVANAAKPSEARWVAIRDRLRTELVEHARTAAHA